MTKTEVADRSHKGDAVVGRTGAVAACGGEPMTVTITNGSWRTGLSSTQLRREIAAGKIRAVKSGTRTLIVMESLRRYIASLPQATLRKATSTQ